MDEIKGMLDEEIKSEIENLYDIDIGSSGLELRLLVLSCRSHSRRTGCEKAMSLKQTRLIPRQRSEIAEKEYLIGSN